MDEKKLIKQRLRAVAVKYDPMDIAPKVIAKGAGIVAEKIIEKGKDADIPVLQDTKLTEELAKLEFGEYIPPELYDAVAQVLIFIGDFDRIEQRRLNAQQY